MLGKAAQYKKDGYRMVQILCTRVPEGYELTYSFDKDYVMENLRVIVPLEGSVMSVTSQYWYAFVWENEIHDLFGLNVEFIAPEVDYGGKFFHLAKPMPWHELSKAQQTWNSLRRKWITAESSSILPNPCPGTSWLTRNSRPRP